MQPAKEWAVLAVLSCEGNPTYNNKKFPLDSFFILTSMYKIC